MLVLVGGLGVYADAQDLDPEEAAERLGLAGIVATSVSQAAQSSARWYALAIGTPVLLYLTRSLLRTLVAVHRLVWGLEARRGHLTAGNVLVFLGALVVFLASGAGVSAGAGRAGWLWLVAAPASVAFRGAIWLLLSLRLPRAPTPWTALVPGALLLGVGVLAVNAFSALAIGEIARSREDTYGALGVAAAILFSLWLTSRVVVLSVVANAAWAGRGADVSASAGSSPQRD